MICNRQVTTQYVITSYTLGLTPSLQSLLFYVTSSQSCACLEFGLVVISGISESQQTFVEPQLAEADQG